MGNSCSNNEEKYSQISSIPQPPPIPPKPACTIENNNSTQHLRYYVTDENGTVCEVTQFR